MTPKERLLFRTIMQLQKSNELMLTVLIDNSSKLSEPDQLKLMDLKPLSVQINEGMEQFLSHSFIVQEATELMENVN